jgi:hypothetical protein
MSGDLSSSGVRAIRDARRAYVRMFVGHLSHQLSLVGNLLVLNRITTDAAIDLIATANDIASALGSDDADLVDAYLEEASDTLTELCAALQQVRS